ncbi:hypothetical protein [Paenibacillus glacialis]|uniref:Uncharacterized protein n=1 Tax=Paenibacillus glacialis TaxID=494026 RepID=A0A168HN27_9BACL|nr:hypothetical protein [Paenibacillus glacialis]OAB38352.1 hypothetical protein PGLA_19840 [Paenibacillus glacialis]
MTVGRKVFAFKDISRIDPISKQTREVHISIYYPSELLGNKPKYTTLLEPCTPSWVAKWDIVEANQLTHSIS